MMLTGKRLLILGCSQDECQIVEAAKELGVYTVTTDNHENWDDAPAKKIFLLDSSKVLPFLPGNLPLIRL